MMPIRLCAPLSLPNEVLSRMKHMTSQKANRSPLVDWPRITGNTSDASVKRVTILLDNMVHWSKGVDEFGELVEKEISYIEDQHGD